MKKFWKAITSLALMLLIPVSLASTAFAASPAITFRGFSGGFEFRPGSEYTETDLFDNFKNVMPGDTVTETVTFTNAAADSDYVNLYIRAETHDETANPLSGKVAETETAASMADFLSRLSMKVWNGAELIYAASPNELDGLKTDRFLGAFSAGETAVLTVELSVPADLGNEYANRVGEVDWVFHVESFNESQLSVRKVWSDGNENHRGETVTVNLLRDGKVRRTRELSAENGWACTFGNLAEGYTWTVEEAQVPEGYTVSYATVGTRTTITNTRTDTPPDQPNPPEPSQPRSLTVRKAWSGDSGKGRPDAVTVTLYNGGAAYETVRLGAWNDWSYTWTDLDPQGNWQVTETNIPKDYTPSYKAEGDTVTITNTRTLIQTGQLNWPIAVLGGLGLVMISLGGIMIFRKKKNRRV